MMKELTRILCVLLCFGMLLCGCDQGGGETETPNTKPSEDLSGPGETDGTETDPTEEENVVGLIEQLTVNGTDISEYVILYPRSDYYQAGKAVLKRIKQEYQYDKITAERVAKLIYELCGVQLEVKMDTAVEESEHEILIGATNRNQSIKAWARMASQDDYVVQVANSKLVICGGTYGTTYHAVDALEVHLKEQNQPAVDLGENFNCNGTYHLTTICCIGDSITYGSQSTDPVYLSYPANLQRLLWTECVIYNYGKGGRTLRSDLKDQNGNDPAWTITAEHTACMGNETKYDYVLIMLGTNDADRAAKYGCLGGYTWNDADDAKYISDYLALVDELKAKDADSVFVVMNCPVSYRVASYDHTRVRSVQAQVAQKLKDRGDEVYFYDMYTYTSENLGSDNFPDQLHPSDEGYALMADGVCAMLQAIWGGKVDQYMIPLN